MKNCLAILLLICTGIAQAATTLTLGQALGLGDTLTLTNDTAPADVFTIDGVWNTAVHAGSASVTVSPAAGNSLVVGFSDWNSDHASSSAADNISGTNGWVKVTETGNGNVGVGLWYKSDLPAGVTTVTVYGSSGASYVSVIAQEVTGGLQLGAAATNTGTSATPDTGSITNGVASSLLFSVLCNSYDPSPSYWQPGLNAAGTIGTWALADPAATVSNTISYIPLSMPYQEVSTTGPQKHVWTSGNSTYASAIAAFSAAPAYFYDDFSRTESPLDYNGSWVSPVATQYGSISANGSNAIGDQHDTSPDYSLGQNSARVVSPAFSPNQAAFAVINNTDTPGVGVRLKSDGTGYMLYCYGGNSLILHRLDGSVPFVAMHTFGAILNVGDTIGLSVSNSTFTVYQNGTPLGTWTDSTYSSGDPGIWLYNDGASIATFWAHDL